MIQYTNLPKSKISIANKDIHVFEPSLEGNIDNKTVKSFSNEWETFSHFSEEEIEKIGDEYFDIVNEKHLNKTSYVLDLGCGTGRWTFYAAKKAGFVFKGVGKGTE